MFPRTGFIVAIILLLATATYAQNTFPATGSAGIGTTLPNASSLLEINSTTKGLLIPRMTLVQRNAIVTPATGLMIYQTNSTPGFYYYSGTAWTAVSPKGASKTLNNLTAPTAVNVDVLPGSDNTISLGSTTQRWKDVNLYNLKFADGSLQTTAFKPYTAGTGISITGGVITNSKPDKVVSLTGAGTTTITGTYPNFTISSSGSSSGWSLTGNAGTNPAANFIGTADAQPLLFKVNNLEAGWIDYDPVKANTGFGYQSLFSNTTGYYNTANGFQSLSQNTIGVSNTANGAYALQVNAWGSYNTANGAYALQSNISGYYNTATGEAALAYNTTGTKNTANGADALYKNTMGSANTADGVEALYFNTMGHDNTASGVQALSNNQSGSDNTANGNFAGWSNDGDENFFGGYKAGYNDNNASYNTMIGAEAGFLGSVVNGSYNTYVGYLTGPASSGFTNSTAIGSGATPTASNQMVFGDGSVHSIGGLVGWTNFSDGRFKKNIHENVHGLDFIKLLRPVTYTLDITGLNKRTGADKKINSLDAAARSTKSEAIAQQEKNIYTGFVAQEVEAAAKKIGYDFSGVDKPKNDKDVYGLRYGDFVVPLVKAVQELSTQNDSLKNNNQDLNSKVDALGEEVKQLRNLVLSIQQTQQQCSPCSAATGSNAVQQKNIIPADVASLQQNTPNPFNNNTVIKYYLPSKTNHAQLIITDMNGHTLKSISISNKGAGQATISANTLSSGSYFYSLIIDGKKIDTKQIELTR